MMRSSPGSPPTSGLSGRAAPVSGSRRRMAPSRVTGSPPVSTSWLRSAPPSAVAATDIKRPVGPEEQAADRVARILLAPVFQEDLFGAGHDVPAGLQARQARPHHTTVAGRPRRGPAAVRRAPDGPPTGRSAPD